MAPAETKDPARDRCYDNRCKASDPNDKRELELPLRCGYRR